MKLDHITCVDIPKSFVDVLLQEGRDLPGDLRLEPLDEGLAVAVHEPVHSFREDGVAGLEEFFGTTFSVPANFNIEQRSRILL